MVMEIEMLMEIKLIMVIVFIPLVSNLEILMHNIISTQSKTELTIL